MKLLDIKNLTFEYFRRDIDNNVEEIVNALSDVSLEIKQGEFVAILGRNGSGKSTLAKHLNALLMPSKGEVIVDGMDTQEDALWLQIRQKVGMVFQNPDNQIVGNLVEEDVAFGPENLGIATEEIWNRVDAALDTTQMEAYRGQSPNQLSGGQKQRVAIAGVLAMNPKCIIFDEATAMLDPQGRKRIISVAEQLRDKGITIILITHHMDEVLRADRVFVMKDGVVKGQGRPLEVFRQTELLEDCGLSLPPLYQYIRFLEGQQIISQKEGQQIQSEQALCSLLCQKYGRGVLSQNERFHHNMQKSADAVKRTTDSINGIADKLQDMDSVQQVGSGVESEKTTGNVKRTQNMHGAVKTREDNISALQSGLILNNVSYIYNKGFANEHAALKHVNLAIGKGEFVAVIGHTGSGKSTLMQHLNGLFLPMEGSVYFNGQDISDKGFSMKELRQKVGLVFQYPEYQLFGETVEKDVCFGPENMNLTKLEVQKRAYEAIAAVGLPDTIYDASPLWLSGGQKRRVAIAGVLAMKPDYLVLDEPTAGLDPLAAVNLLDMLKQLQEKEGITVVIVSHSMEEVAEYAERIVVMENGEKYMDGSVSEVFGKQEQLEQLGLSVPFGIRLLYSLRQAGVNVNVLKHRMLDICGELAQL